MKKIIIFSLFGILSVILIIFLGNKDQKLEGTNQQLNTFSNVIANATSSLASASSTEIFAKNANRQYAEVCNATTTAGAGVYVSYATSADSISPIMIRGGKYLKETECHVISGDSLFTGAVFIYNPNDSSTTLGKIEK